MAALPDGKQASSDGATKFSVSADELKDVLECPVCLNSFLDPPIYVCVNQHGLCLACQTKFVDQVGQSEQSLGYQPWNDHLG